MEELTGAGEWEKIVKSITEELGGEDVVSVGDSLSDEGIGAIYTTFLLMVRDAIIQKKAGLLTALKDMYITTFDNVFTGLQEPPEEQEEEDNG